MLDVWHTNIFFNTVMIISYILCVRTCNMYLVYNIHILVVRTLEICFTYRVYFNHHRNHQRDYINYCIKYIGKDTHLLRNNYLQRKIKCVSFNLFDLWTFGPIVIADLCNLSRIDSFRFIYTVKDKKIIVHKRYCTYNVMGKKFFFLCRVEDVSDEIWTALR